MVVYCLKPDTSSHIGDICFDSSEGHSIKLYDYSGQGELKIYTGLGLVLETQVKLPGNNWFQSMNSHCSRNPTDEDCGFKIMFNNIKRIKSILKKRMNYQLSSYVATINCQITTNPEPVNSQITKNPEPVAYWIPKKQQVIIGNYDSHALSQSPDAFLDIIAHEFFHGYIKNKFPKFHLPHSKDNQRENTALEESLCDIFAVLVRNTPKDNDHDIDISQWDWKIGQGFGEGGEELRDLSQQRTMEDYNNGKNNHHDNSLIYSHAFYQLITSHLDYFKQDKNEGPLELFINFMANLGENDNTFQRSYKKLLDVLTQGFNNDEHMVATVTNPFD
ncbi:MAG: M4 family metallopeptidase [Crocosphaera sp.]|nr:M4 family metallopeptidase [Crocosphaera sp.]